MYFNLDDDTTANVLGQALVSDNVYLPAYTNNAQPAGCSQHVPILVRSLQQTRQSDQVSGPYQQSPHTRLSSQFPGPVNNVHQTGYPDQFQDEDQYPANLEYLAISQAHPDVPATLGHPSIDQQQFNFPADPEHSALIDNGQVAIYQYPEYPEYPGTSSTSQGQVQGPSNPGYSVPDNDIPANNTNVPVNNSDPPTEEDLKNQSKRQRYQEAVQKLFANFQMVDDFGPDDLEPYQWGVPVLRPELYVQVLQDWYAKDTKAVDIDKKMPTMKREMEIRDMLDAKAAGKDTKLCQISVNGMAVSGAEAANLRFHILKSYETFEELTIQELVLKTKDKITKTGLETVCYPFNVYHKWDKNSDIKREIQYMKSKGEVLSTKPKVTWVEESYMHIVRAHIGENGKHGSRDQTFERVQRYSDTIKKELVALFVKHCNCQAKEPDNHLRAPPRHRTFNTDVNDIDPNLINVPTKASSFMPQAPAPYHQSKDILPDTPPFTPEDPVADDQSTDILLHTPPASPKTPEPPLDAAPMIAEQMAAEQMAAEQMAAKQMVEEQMVEEQMEVDDAEPQSYTAMLEQSEDDLLQIMRLG